MWKKGTQREDFKFHDFEHLVRQGAFNEEGVPCIITCIDTLLLIHLLQLYFTFFLQFLGGMFRSENIAANLIDHYIPFLPLEERQVRGCINDAFRKLGYESAPLEAIE